MSDDLHARGSTGASLRLVPSVTAAATFCATLADEWVRGGVTDVVLAPGSRSTPLALAVAAQPGLQVHVLVDERSAGFVALGLGLATGRPAVLICTSGTAAANFHPAVIEAHQAEVPLVVCTADRPPELRDVGAPQTIDQDRLYTTSVRWFCDPGVPDDAVRDSWRSIAARAVVDSLAPRPGPVHLNLPFRDPLVGRVGEVPAGRRGGQPWHRTPTPSARLAPEELDDLVTILDEQRGVIVAGAGAGDPDAVHALADALDWPVLADPRSGCRLPRRCTVAAFDELLRHPRFAADHTPTVVLRLGQPPASKVLAQWLDASEAPKVHVASSPAWSDPDHHLAHRIVADPTWLCRAVTDQVRGATGTPWLARWRNAEEKAQRTVDDVLGSYRSRGMTTEPGIARALLSRLPHGGALVASSSMPVRDVEWYGAPREGVRIMANRGANGIDGVVSTAAGVARSGVPTALLIGDIAFVHDSNGLLGLGRSSPDDPWLADLLVVVLDNEGGGIFSFLSQASEVKGERFEQLFGTPPLVDIPQLAGAYGVGVHHAADETDFDGLVQHWVEYGGVQVVHVRTVDRDTNVAVHDAIHAAVQRAL